MTTKEEAETKKLDSEADKLAAEALKLSSETKKIDAETSKLEEELNKVKSERNKINQEIEGLKATRSRLTVIATAFRDVAVMIGVPVTILTVATAVNSVRLTQDAERRMHESSVSEIDARRRSADLAAEVERRVRESTARELEVRALASFMAEVLPRIGGATSPRVIDQCLAAHATDIGRGASAQQVVAECTGHVPMPRAAQVGGYQAAVELALRYPMLCSATRAPLMNNARGGDTEAAAALNRLGNCAALVPVIP